MVKQVIYVPWGQEASFSTTTKVLVGHILHSTQDRDFKEILVYKGYHLNYIEIVGIVVRESRKEYEIYLTIDDGTGLLDCMIKKALITQYCKIDADESPLLESCVRLIGAIEYCPFSRLSQTLDGEGDLCSAQLNVTAIQICKDTNDEYVHWMEVIKREKDVFPT